MAIIKSFEDLSVWQKARLLVKEIYMVSSKFPRDERFGLANQIRRAAVSIMANIAEGFSRYHLAETIMFYRISRGSLSEVKSHLFVALDLRYLSQVIFDDLIRQLDEVGKMLNGLIKSTESFRKTKS